MVRKTVLSVECPVTNMTLIGELPRKVNRLNVLPNITLLIVAFPTNGADVKTMIFLDITMQRGRIVKN